MNWITNSGHTICKPYQIVRETLDYTIWLQTSGHYGILCRGVPSLETAKIYCENHGKKLDAVDAK